MKKIFITISYLFILTIPQVLFAATCTLDTNPSPPVTSYEKNIDTLLSAIKKEWGKKSCPSIEVIAGNTTRVLNKMQGSDYDIWNFFRNNAFFLDTSDKMLLPSAKKHDDYILSIQQKILATGAEIGGKCAGDEVRFEQDIQIGNSRYKTKNRILQEVLNDMYTQNGKVLSFYRDLVSNVQNNEYLDESKFTVAPEGFSDEMREFYSPANIQQCHDEDAKKKKIEKTQQEWLQEAMKYPESVSVWKKAFELLLYWRSAQPETPEEANPTTTAYAKTGGLGNSMTLLNQSIFKIFWFLGNSQWWPAEKVRESSKKRAADVGLVQSSFPELAEALKNAGWNASPSIILAEYDKVGYLSNFARLSSSNQDENLNNNIAPNAEQNNNHMVPLVQTMEMLVQDQEDTKENAEKYCEAYGRQAENYPGKETCEKIMEEASQMYSIIQIKLVHYL
jgi:hypothetical protein